MHITGKSRSEKETVVIYRAGIRIIAHIAIKQNILQSMSVAVKFSSIQTVIHDKGRIVKVYIVCKNIFPRHIL